ncbi:Methyltransferase-like protein 13 [Symbiodinium microadriaticum]|uniref:Methyltransferase-like protein 13 n=1 Tax=Symbiodinium microadriaticum TaxID=2951 RepID=A0A1Q9C9J8_SYMMI|nr:Methyltransferase-like protein 13 [Symbiodinium microadriaticum]
MATLGCLGDVCGAIDRLVVGFRRRFALRCGGRSWLGRKEYWDAAYASGRYAQTYEWNQTCEVIWPFVEKLLENRHGSKVLHVGCGNSRLGRKLVDAGFRNVINVDYSSEVIDMMRKQEPELTWWCLDCAEPGALGEDEFDAAIDKGALDSLFEAGSEALRQRGGAMAAEVHRALKTGGKYLIISNGGLGSEVLASLFRKVESEEIEGYTCDLYYKLVTILLCTK